jgi:hypothetical protein
MGWGVSMPKARFFLAAALICGASTSALAVEGSTAAGPIGGTDIRSAMLPPPGLYAGSVFVAVTAFDFVDGHGNAIAALKDARLTGKFAAPFFVYVPEIQVFGGSIGLLGVFPLAEECGRLFAATPKTCQSGSGDPYVEIAWSRSFGILRPSKFPGAFPIFEGLTIMFGFGVVFPFGQYDRLQASTQGLSIGDNIYDFAPSVAFTYTTPPVISEGTEFSAKLYWNNYRTNPATQYATGSLFNLDFAISERMGRWQIGVAGFYAVQSEDDELFGVRIPPDGRRAEVLNLGGVVAYDLPEYNASIKIKTLSTVSAKNAPHAWRRYRMGQKILLNFSRSQAVRGLR